ncbi:MAG: hypothetical protein QOF89_3882 [Acidobacteriota bacterium]|jgi:hypothetical protein|nr:hypothetical protein [Acidobacteriota bacterium]
MRAKMIRASMIVLLLLLLAGKAGAQFQYTPPGGPEEKPATRKAALALEMSLARYRLGPVRIAPWAAVRNLAYVRTLFSSGQTTPADFTATAGAGFHAYLHNGPKVTWSLGVLPEYVWWRRQTERRRLNGRYQLGLHGFFNRLTVEATLGRDQRLQLVTPEVPVLASARADGGEVLAEVELTSILFAFTSAAETKQTNLVDTEQDPRAGSLVLLDRKERLLRAGLRWQPDEDLSLALGVESSRVDFERTALPRSNSGTSPLLQIRYHGRHLGFEGEIADRSLKARRGADFVPFNQVTGNAAVLLGVGSRLNGSVYGSRNLIYSLATGYAYLQDDRLGATVSLDLGFRTRGRVFAELGRNDYTAFAPGIPPRRDRVSAFGGVLDFDLGGQVTLGLQALRSKFDSNLPGSDRTYSSAGVTLSLFGGR